MSDLDAAAQKRKERLALLKSAKRKRDGEETEVVTPREPDNAAPKMGYRNYDPETKSAKLGYLHNPSDLADEQTVEKRAEELAAKTKAEAELTLQSQEPIDLFNLQPKKPNWDLKRDLNKKLDRLKAKQDKVVLQHVKERIKLLQSKKDKTGNLPVLGRDLAKEVQRREQEQISAAGGLEDN